MIHNNVQDLRDLDPIIDELIKSSYISGKLRVSISELFVQCRDFKGVSSIGDFPILAYILYKINLIVPNQKWNWEHLLLVVEKYSDIPRESKDYKAIIKSNLSRYCMQND